MSEGWALFTTYSGQVCQAGNAVAQEAVALGPCLSYLDQSTGIVLANYKQLYASASGSSQFSIITYQYLAADLECTGAQPTVTTDGPYSSTALGCYNQIFTKGPTDPNANSLTPSSSTFRFIPGLDGGYNIPEFNLTGVLSVSFSEPCTSASTPTSVRVLTSACMTGSGSSTMYKCSPSWSATTYQMWSFSGSGTCCADGGSCTEYGSSFSFTRCRTALKTTDSRYRYENQTCTTPAWPSSPPAPLPALLDAPTYFPRPSTAPPPHALPSTRGALSTHTNASTPLPVILGLSTAIPATAVLLLLCWCYRQRRSATQAPTPGPAAGRPRPRSRTPGIVATEAVVANPLSTMEPLEVEAELVRPRGKLQEGRERDSLAGVVVVEARAVRFVDPVDPIPAPSAPPPS